jgi:hypothetical protein
LGYIKKRKLDYFRFDISDRKKRETKLREEKEKRKTKKMKRPK